MPIEEILIQRSPTSTTIESRTIVSVSDDRLSPESRIPELSKYKKIKTLERALKDENRRLHNKLDQLSLHGTQVDQHEESPAESADDELEKETNLLKTEIMLMKKSLTEVSKLNTDLKVDIFFAKNWLFSKMWF